MFSIPLHYFARIGPQVLAFYRNLLNLRLLFKNQTKLRLSSVFKWLDISKLKMPKLIAYCSFNISEVRLIPLYRLRHPRPAVPGFWFADAIVALFAVLCYHRFQQLSG